MKIIKSKGDFTKAEIFNMTQGTVAKVSDHVGEVLELAGWVLYEDEDKDGKAQSVLALKELNGMVSATISRPFIEQFFKMLEFMGDEEFNIKVIGATSKNNREYIICEAVQ